MNNCHRYFPHTEDDIRRMLERCGAASLDDLYSDVDPSLRMKKPYDLPGEMSEMAVRRFFDALDSRNSTLRCFAGFGFYDHYTPAAVTDLVRRSEFLTAYTPYQPEISQGTLRAIFEFQSMIAELTGLDVANASVYDGATATAEAMMMTVASARKRNRVLISATMLPQVREVAATYARYHGITLDTIPATGDGVTDRQALSTALAAGDVAGVIVATPNLYGIIEDLTGLADECHAAKALLVVNSPASALAVLRSPGQWGADIAVGDAQSLGIPLSYGGPGLGYMTTTKALMRKLPGRIVGATTDADGRRMFVLTLQAREQHIRREKATSNICSNQGLMVVVAAIYMSLLGAEGLTEVNRAGAATARALRDRLVASGLMKEAFPGQPFLNEFTLSTALDIDALREFCAGRGFLCGVRSGERLLTFAATETVSPDDALALADTIEEFARSSQN